MVNKVDYVDVFTPYITNKNNPKDGLTPIFRIFCTEFNEEPKVFDIVVYPYLKLMETIREKISEYLKRNYVYSIYECVSVKNVKVSVFMWMQKRDFCLMKITLRNYNLCIGSFVQI